MSRKIIYLVTAHENDEELELLAAFTEGLDADDFVELITKASPSKEIDVKEIELDRWVSGEEEVDEELE